MGFIINAITNAHVLTVALKAVGRAGKLFLNSHFGMAMTERLLALIGIH